ncbi:MAG: peroxiredoxin [Rhodocyclaceae bacterium]|nr:peroxiredoxin [Rhodocyclaceae bacterium]
MPPPIGCMCCRSSRVRALTTEVRGLALLLWSATPERPQICVTPFIHALAARALDAEVEIHFAGPAVRLLVAGVADHLYPTPEREKSLLAFMAEASAAGAAFFACSMARAAFVAGGESLIPQARAAGATTFVARSLDPAWRTLVF